MLKLKLQYFGHLNWRTDSLENTLMLWKSEGRKGRGQQRLKCLDGITNSMDIGLGGLWVLLMNREAWHAAVHCIAKSLSDSLSHSRLNGWTELFILKYCLILCIQHIYLWQKCKKNVLHLASISNFNNINIKGIIETLNLMKGFHYGRYYNRRLDLQLDRVHQNLEVSTACECFYDNHIFMFQQKS